MAYGGDSFLHISVSPVDLDVRPVPEQPVAMTVCCEVAISVATHARAYNACRDVLTRGECWHVCMQDRREYIRLQAVPFAESGAWAMNFWFRFASANNGSGLSYLFSTVGTGGAASPLDTNQVFNAFLVLLTLFIVMLKLFIVLLTLFSFF